MQNFFLDLLHTDHSGDQQTGRKCSDRHHHRVCQEVKEIKELHSNDLYTGKRSISQGRKTSENKHDRTDYQCGLLSAPFQLILKG